MKKTLIIFVVALLLLQSVLALSANDAKQDWLDAKQVSKEKQSMHQDAKLALAGDNSEENRQAVVDTGKDLLNAALNEAEAWLKWKDVEAEENPEVPADLKQQVFDDVETNLAKVDGLREDVDGVENQLQLGLVTVKMVGKYFELVADVARNSGAMWVHIGNEKADTIEDYETKLRAAAGDNQEVLDSLDMARAELENARENIDKAGDTYKLVKIPGQPLIKFSEGNNYLNAAKMNLISAQEHLMKAYNLLVR